MFEQTLLNSRGRTRRPLAVVVSFIFQCVLVGLLVLVPLVYTDALPRAKLMGFLVAPSPPPPAPPPPSPAAVVKAVKAIPRQFEAGKLLAPRAIPPRVAQIEEAELPLSVGGVSGGVPGGIPGGGPGGIVDDIIKAVPKHVPSPPPPVVREAPKPSSVQRIRVGGNVQQAKVLYQPKPVYPPLAKAARVQGVVRFTAVIGLDGTIQNLQLLAGGHPLLVDAARNAVMQWRYQPTLLNGEPVEVITQIDVNFTLQ